MATVTGKKQESTWRTSPWAAFRRNRAPRMTSTASARDGQHRHRLQGRSSRAAAPSLSSVYEWMIYRSRAQPQGDPHDEAGQGRAGGHPGKQSRLRGDDSGQSAMLAHRSTAIWCGAGRMGCMLSVAAMRSRQDHSPGRQPAPDGAVGSCRPPPGTRRRAARAAGWRPAGVLAQRLTLMMAPAQGFACTSCASWANSGIAHREVALEGQRRLYDLDDAARVQ